MCIRMQTILTNHMGVHARQAYARDKDLMM